MKETSEHIGNIATLSISSYECKNLKNNEVRWFKDYDLLRQATEREYATTLPY